MVFRCWLVLEVVKVGPSGGWNLAVSEGLTVTISEVSEQLN